MFSRKPKVEGYLYLYGLSDWWFATFTEDERRIIDERYQPIGLPAHTLTKGKFSGEGSGRASQLLSGLSTWFMSPDDFDIACRILEKAAEIAEDPRDQHFTYQWMIRIYYRQRDIIPGALDKTISVCQKQIAIATTVAAMMKTDFPTIPLPNHVGYEQLVIILDKQGRYAEAIQLSKQAKEQGWGGDWYKRIEKYEKKIINRSR